MKTQILQLEAHDDALSARDKLAWGQTGRIVLVWPARGRVLTRRLDLLLLLRQSQSMGIQLALVVSDPDVRYHARQLGISTFNNLRQAQKARWKRPEPRAALRQWEAVEARQVIGLDDGRDRGA